MTFLRSVAIALCLLGSLAVMSACSTGTPAVKNYFGTFIARVAAPPDRVTEAAKKACEELKFTDVTSTGTKIDGKVRARTALRDEVEINIELDKNNGSELSIRVGDAGDEPVSRQIWERTFENLR